MQGSRKKHNDEDHEEENDNNDEQEPQGPFGDREIRKELTSTQSEKQDPSFQSTLNVHTKIQPNITGRVPPPQREYQNTKRNDYLNMNLSGSSKYSVTNVPHQIFDSHYARPQKFDEKPTIGDYDNHSKTSIQYSVWSISIYK